MLRLHEERTLSKPGFSEKPGLERVVDITQIPEMHRIERVGDTVVIGAGATFSEVIESAIVAQTAPVLVQACHAVGATQIRNWSASMRSPRR